MGCRVLPEEPSGFKCFTWVAIYTFGGQRLSIFGYRLIPATTWSHGCLCRLPPLLSFACAELVMNVEELGCHGMSPFGTSWVEDSVFVVARSTLEQLTTAVAASAAD